MTGRLMTRHYAIVLSAVLAVGALTLGGAAACYAEPINVATVREAAAAKTCLVIGEDALGAPVAFATGFRLGTGNRVVTDLASIAQPGVKTVRLRFADGKETVVKAFDWSDPAAGLVILHLEDNAPAALGLPLATASTISGAEVAVVGWKWAKAVDVTVARLSNGVTAATLGATLKVDPPPGDLVFLKIDSERPAAAGGAAVCDATGGVVGVLLQVAGTDKALIVPSSRLRGALLSPMASKPLSQLPEPVWPVSVETLPGEPATAEDFSAALRTIRQRSLCPMCGGKGHLTVQKTSSRSEEQTCTECQGEGVVFPAGLYAKFEKLAESAAWLTLSPDSDSKGAQWVYNNIETLLKSLARLGPIYRSALSQQAKADLEKGAYPRGLFVYARINGWADGPDGPYSLLESEALASPMAIKNADFGEEADGKGGKPKDGQWIILAGWAVGQVTLLDEKPILVRPLAWVPGPNPKAPAATPTSTVISPPTSAPTTPRTPRDPKDEPNFFGL
jgi:hypothetical protein